MAGIGTHLEQIENTIGRLSPVQKILLGTEGSVTHLLEVITGSRIGIVTRIQKIIPANAELAKLLEIAEGDSINYRVVEIQNSDTGETLIYATSHTPLSRLTDEFRDDLMKADIPIGRIIQQHRIESRREILDARVDVADNEVRTALRMFRNEPLLSREYRIIHKGHPLIRIREQFPYHQFLDERRVIVGTPARIHLGLIDMNGSIGRVDGSVGIALDEPGTLLEAHAGENLEIRGGDTGTQEVVKCVAENVLSAIHAGSKAHITLRSLCPRHAGLGSGTQLALATARAICELYGKDIPTRDLARITGRGGTSGIGTAAFGEGGFIIDGGHRFGLEGGKNSFRPSSASRGIPPAPVIARYEFPEDWKILLAVPNLHPGANGSQEVDIFRNCCPVPIHEVREICHEILMRMLPGILERDLDMFGSSVDRIQDLGFKRVEHSLQAPHISSLMNAMRAAGASCAGMSSFGPAIYAITDTNLPEIVHAARTFMDAQNGGEIYSTSACNTGARVRTIGAS
ncbi:MAG: beta-ribofuranosylaminobenzene 5'-phosphate synthase [Methanoregulaceae archaeon]